MLNLFTCAVLSPQPAYGLESPSWSVLGLHQPFVDSACMGCLGHKQPERIPELTITKDMAIWDEHK